MQSTTSIAHPTLLFDGVCNLCDGFVQWVIRRDPEAIFRFTALQSEAGQALLHKHDLPTKELSTVILIHNNQLYTHSDVALEICKLLGGFWQVFYVFKIVPPFIRNGIYNWVAKNRYRWFGEKDACMIPTPELKSRFLD